MILYNSLRFLMFSDESLIQKVNIKSSIFYRLCHMKIPTSAKIFTQSKLKVFGKNLIHQRISERS